MSPTILYISDILSRAYPPDEARSLALWLAEELTGKSRGELLLRQEPIEISGLDSCLRRLLDREPVQYIFGRTEWMGLRLRVTRDTLIPRPETAELTEWVVRDNASHAKPLRVVDIGTGSGCIAIALKQRLPRWDVSAWDVSGAALAVARDNARRNGAEITFAQEDITRHGDGSKSEPARFDIAVSNPPYIPETDKAAMDGNVVRYEPPEALFVPDSDPLVFYRAIARRRLSPTLYLEIHERMGDAVRSLLTAEGYTDVTLRKDSYGKDRMVRAKLIIDN